MYPVPSWEDFLSLAVDETRQFGEGSVQVTRRLRALLEDLREAVPEFRRAAVDAELRLLDASADRAFTDRGDRLSAAARDRQGLGAAGHARSRRVASEPGWRRGSGAFNRVPGVPRPSHSSPPRRGHPRWVLALTILGTILTFAAIFSIWVNRQALNTDNWVDTSTRLVQNEEVRSQLSDYLAKQLFANADVAEELRGSLPPRLAPLATAAASGLQQLAPQVAERLLATSQFEKLWEAANRKAHEALLTGPERRRIGGLDRKRRSEAEARAGADRTRRRLGRGRSAGLEAAAGSRRNHDPQVRRTLARAGRRQSAAQTARSP